MDVQPEALGEIETHQRRRRPYFPGPLRVLPGLLFAALELYTSGVEAQSVQTHQIKFAMQSTAGSAQYDAAVRFADNVRTHSRGRLDIKIFGGGVLGSDVAVVSAMRGGTIEMAVLNTSLLTGVVKQMGVFDFPFVFASEREAYAVVDGSFGRRLHDMLEAKGLVGLS